MPEKGHKKQCITILLVYIEMDDKLVGYIWIIDLWIYIYHLFMYIYICISFFLWNGRVNGIWFIMLKFLCSKPVTRLAGDLSKLEAA